MAQLGFGIVGTGLIAGVVADAIGKASNARLVAASSREIGTAQKFVAERAGVAAVQGFEALLGRADVDAVYVAIPTAPKEEVTLAAIAAGKHVLVDKPFADRASLLRMTDAATKKGVAFMDATHFVHHPRTATVRAATAEKIGAPRSLQTVFYFPVADPNNIRFNAKLEPMGAIGDMAWYSMRAVVEYLRPQGRITKVAAVVERGGSENSAVVRASGMIAFASGEVSTFDVGYTAGTVLMDLGLVGTKGAIEMDDFVLDWNSSFAFKNADVPTGYSHRTGMATRKDVTFIPTPSSIAGEVAMVQDFVELATSKNAALRAESISVSLKTQEYVDAIWAAARS
jgi:predicted dehydrogenase